MRVTSTKIGSRNWRHKEHKSEFCGSSKGALGDVKDFAIHVVIDGRSIMIRLTESEAKIIIEHWSK